MKYITPAQLQDALAKAFGTDEPLRVCLEPEVIMESKLSDGRDDELWAYNPETSSIERGDGKFFRVDYVTRGRDADGTPTWGQPRIYEEPNIAAPQDGGPRIVATIFLVVNPRGLIRTRTNDGLNGKILEANPTSISRGEKMPEGARLTRRLYIELNPQRLEGIVQVDVVLYDFPDNEGMPLMHFVQLSTDARSLAALAASAFLTPVGVR